MTNSPIADDLLKGVPAIAAYIGEEVPRTYRLLRAKQIPALKQGKLWRARKSSLDRYYAGEAATDHGGAA